ncbi:MAG: tetratricopeptide repeat protein [Alphaproteobacteria bacterium]|nr:MAG: tetratricopeptide repeat protein [Alphaproteobacteria bacterium]
MSDNNQQEKTRRLATILAADILGYSRLMDADEEGTYAALLSARSEVIEPKIKKHKARIVKHTGDGFLAEFPTVLSAVKFAMELQEEMARRAKDAPKDLKIKFRIGINIGDIIVDDTGDVFGDGVNIAARLETLGIPGGICISDSVYRAVHKNLKVKFDDLGGQKVKNIPEKIHAYDVRWPGEGGTPDERTVKATSKRKFMAQMAGAVAAAVALIWIAVSQMFPSEPEVAAALDNSIAVMAFVNMSDDASNEYFSDGIAEELLNLLAKIPELRVTSRTSAFSYKGKDIDTPTIAAELNVSYVLEGSVRKSGNQVRITAQLIEARSDTHIWSETYDRTLDDIFATQDEIAARVVEQLKVTLLGEAPKVRETDPEAYALVLQARYLEQQGTSDAFEKSIALFEQALEIDPDYAAAWAGLASVYRGQVSMALLPIDEGFTLAREAANLALEIDPANAPAYRSLARIAMDYDRDLEAAAQNYQRALALETANTNSISGAAAMAANLDRLDQAISLGEYVVARDPVSPVGNRALGLYYFYAGRLDEAIASFRTTLTLSPGYSGAYYKIGEALLLKGEPQAALAAIQKEPLEVYRLIGLVTAHHALGDAAASDATLAELIEKYEKDGAWNIAYVLAVRGEADRAFEWLSKAVAYNDAGLSETVTTPQFANLHNDPRWLPFLESIGMSHEQLAAIEFNVTLPE